jgi:peptidyl-prolyl cis-trans isomerase D
MNLTRLSPFSNYRNPLLFCKISNKGILFMAMEALRVAAKESKIMKFVLGGFIALAVGGLVFTDVGGYFTGGASGTTIARVGDTKIDIREFDRQIQPLLQQTGLTAQEAYETGLIQSLLNQRANEILKIEAAQDLNLKVNNTVIANQLSTLFGANNRDEIEMRLRAQGMTESQLASTIQANILSQIMTQMPLAYANYIPDYMNAGYSALQNQTRSGQIYTTSLSNFADEITISDEEIATYYQNNREQYILPEERSFLIGKMTLNMAKENLPEITMDDVRAEYEASIEDFIIPETRIITQARFNDPDVAQTVYEAALSGDKTLVEAFNSIEDNSGSLSEELEYTFEGLPSELAETAFSTDVKEVTPPIRTNLGIIIMQINEIQPETIQEFDTVKDELMETMQQQAIYDALYNKMLDTEDMIDSGNDFQSIAEKTGLSINETESFTLSSLTTAEGDLGMLVEQSPSIADEIFGIDPSSATYPIELDDESYVVIGVSEVKPQSDIPLEDVKNDIENAIIQLQKMSLAEAELEQIISGLNNDTLSLSTIEDEYSFQRENFNELSKSNDIQSNNIIFQIPAGEYAYRLDDVMQQASIFYVDTVEISKNSDLSDGEITDYRQLQRQIADSVLSAVYRDKYGININQNLLRQSYADSIQ